MLDFTNQKIHINLTFIFCFYLTSVFTLILIFNQFIRSSRQINLVDELSFIILVNDIVSRKILYKVSFDGNYQLNLGYQP